VVAQFSIKASLGAVVRSSDRLRVPFTRTRGRGLSLAVPLSALMCFCSVSSSQYGFPWPARFISCDWHYGASARIQHARSHAIALTKYSAGLRRTVSVLPLQNQLYYHPRSALERCTTCQNRFGAQKALMFIPIAKIQMIAHAPRLTRLCRPSISHCRWVVCVRGNRIQHGGG
jgi:hypothetical protein